MFEKECVFGEDDLCKLCFDMNEITCSSVHHIISDVHCTHKQPSAFHMGYKHYVGVNKFLNVCSYKPTISKKA